MKIGIDLTPIGEHRMRGIGAVLINVVNELPTVADRAHEFVFFVEAGSDRPHNPRDLVDVGSLKHEFRLVTTPAEPTGLPRLRRFTDLARRCALGDPRSYDTTDLDIFVQADPSVPLPRTRAKTVLIAHDIIPYVLESTYLTGYRVSRNRGFRVYRSFKNEINRQQYFVEMRSNARRADLVIADSAHTRRDVTDILGIDERKVDVVHLGVTAARPSPPDVELRPYRDVGWGPLQEPPIELEPQSFLLYLGGVDARRQLMDLFGAFNNLRARGESIQLVMAGDVLSTIENIPDGSIRDYARRCSYSNDMILLGFVTEAEKAWLFQNALALVFPTLYEGFGLPVLEAMSQGTPVITYDNSSLREVGGDAALYAESHQDIVRHATRLRDDPDWRDAVRVAGLEQARSFSWARTASEMLAKMTALTRAVDASRP